MFGVEGTHVVVILCIDIFYGSAISTQVCRLLLLFIKTCYGLHGAMD